MRACKHFFIAFLFSLISSSFGQEQGLLQQQEEKPSELITYQSVEIPAKTEEISLYIQKLEGVVQPSQDIALIDSSWDVYLKNKEDLLNEADLDNLDQYNTRKLEDLRQRWANFDEKMSGWQSIVGERVTELEVEKSKLEEMIGIWQRTYDNALSEEAPAELLQSVRDIQSKLKKYQTEIGKLITKDLKIQTALADESIALGINVSKLIDALNQRRQSIFSQDTAPLWEALGQPKDTAALSTQMSDVWELYRRSANDFIEINKRNIAIDIFLFLILLLLVYGFKNFSKKLESPGNSLDMALRLLERPISISVLLFLLFFFLIYPELPEVLVSFIKMLILIPLLRIITNISHKSVRIPLYGLATLLVLSEIQSISPTESLLERIVLLMLTILALSGFLWLLIKRPIQSAMEGKKGFGAIKTGIRIAVIFFGVSLLANIFGYITLAEILVVKTLNSIFAAVILVTASITLNALLDIFLLSKIAGKLKVVKLYPDKIKITTGKIIRYAFIFWWVTIFLLNFEILLPVEDYFLNFVTGEWAIGTFSISIADVVLFFVTIWISVLLARLIRFFLEGDVLSRMTLPRGVPGAISAIVKYIIVGFGIVVAFSAAGLDLDKFALLAGALGVGIGFGLQDLVRNFISGLILIFERPIQIGDAVQIDTLSGKVMQIGIRSSIIKTWQGAEVIVPNGQLIANKLVNWTMTDRLRRLDIKVGVSYGTNIELVMQTLLKCAKDQQDILTTPAPYVLFNDFAESYLEFELRCWTSHPDWIFIRSDIRVAIDEAFEKEGVVIPFPQRDLHIISDRTKEEKTESDVTSRKKRFENEDEKDSFDS
ncbi:MAG: mechanosensitive ion channel [Ignavibacteria bacterium]|nr:mechanosensitive ion channel [Ignavibacteria bacterium]NNL19906.1 mechanosensitive ion channel [Ignavibacteriaceae bacterium]